MGKLAERYADAARSGVYRVDSAEIPRRAALEACAHLWEIDAGEAHALETLGRRISPADKRPHVLLMTAAGDLAASPALYAAVVEALSGMANDCRAHGMPFFAVLVDPAATLALPRLYKERVKEALD